MKKLLNQWPTLCQTTSGLLTVAMLLLGAGNAQADVVPLNDTTFNSPSSASFESLVCKMPSCEELTVTTADGMNIIVQDWGHNKQNKPTLIFLHGTPFDHTLWTNQVHSDLKTTYRLITMDYRGHGRADEVTDPSQILQMNWANDIAAVLNNPHYAISKAILVAHSLGGIPVGDYLLQYGAAKVGGVIMVAAPFDSQGLLTGATHTQIPSLPCDVSQSSSNLCGELDLFLATLPPMSSEEFWAANKNLVELKFVTPIPQGELSNLTSSAILLSQTSRIAFLNGVLAEVGINKTSAIAALHVPTLFLFGDRDRTQYLQVYLNRYFSGGVPAIPGSSYKVYQNMDHIPMLQAKIDFNHDVANFAFSIFGQ